MSQDQPDFSLPTLGSISKESRLSWRSQLSNNGITATGLALGGNFRAGKFFPRGCRGFITTIDVLIANPAGVADTVTVYISPLPYINYLYSAAIAVPPNIPAQWLTATFNIMWNYDSLFIWVSITNALAFVHYDTEAPYDYYLSNDAAATWTTGNRRLWIRVNFVGETAGDVPVSGTINVIEIPNVATETEATVLAVPNAVWTTMLTINGAGTLAQVKVWYSSLVAPAAAVVYSTEISIDGAFAMTVDNRDLTQSVVAVSGRSSMGEFYQDALATILAFRIPLKFKRTLRLRVFQTTGVPINVTAAVITNMVT